MGFLHYHSAHESTDIFLACWSGRRVSPALAFGTDMQKQLKIVGLETDVLRFPPGQIFYDAIHEFGAASGAVVLRLKTDEGFLP
jgi:hypothetical protein